MRQNPATFVPPHLERKYIIYTNSLVKLDPVVVIDEKPPLAVEQIPFAIYLCSTPSLIDVLGKIPRPIIMEPDPFHRREQGVDRSLDLDSFSKREAHPVKSHVQTQKAQDP